MEKKNKDTKGTKRKFGENHEAEILNPDRVEDVDAMLEENQQSPAFKELEEVFEKFVTSLDELNKKYPEDAFFVAAAVSTVKIEALRNGSTENISMCAVKGPEEVTHQLIDGIISAWHKSRENKVRGLLMKLLSGELTKEEASRITMMGRPGQA